MEIKMIEIIAECIYEATRKEAEWSGRSIVPEHWSKRDKKFKKQMIGIIQKYLALKKLPSPKEAHDYWMKAYLDMGWKYGKIKDSKKRTHPDLVPYNQLPKDERDKDAIFLAFIYFIRNFLKMTNIYGGK
jgi:hypothetical protein